MKIMQVNCGFRSKFESDIRRNEHYLSLGENKALRKFRPVPDLNP